LRKERLLYLADAVVHPLHFEHPEWAAAIDEDPAALAITRRSLLELAVAENLLVAASHLWRPGRVTSARGGFRFLADQP